MPQNPYLFKGGIQDRTTGWVHYGARWYNPGTGRWTQQDTLDNPLDPANANRCAYAGDDPINNLDPTGNSPGSDVCYTEFVIEGLLVDGVIALAGLPTAGAAWAVGGIVDIALYEAAKAACG